MTDEEWYEMLRSQAEMAEKEYNDAVDAIAKASLPYSDDLILKYLIAKEKYRITERRYWCACKGYSLKNWIDPR